MEQLIFSLILFVVVVLPFLFFAVCCVVGTMTENAHFKQLAVDEQELSDIAISDMKTLPPNWKATKPMFLCENVVIANDSLKTFLWQYRKLVGGRCGGYEKLLERARREATVRLLKRAREQGVNVVWNVRFETVTLQIGYSDGNGNQYPAGVECLAYGTGFFVES